MSFYKDQTWVYHFYGIAEEGPTWHQAGTFSNDNLPCSFENMLQAITNVTGHPVKYMEHDKKGRVVMEKYFYSVTRRNFFDLFVLKDPDKTK